MFRNLNATVAIQESFLVGLRIKMSQKKKTVVVSVEQKLQAIQRLDKGEIPRIVAAYCGIKPNTGGN